MKLAFVIAELEGGGDRIGIVGLAGTLLGVGTQQIEQATVRVDRINRLAVCLAVRPTLLPSRAPLPGLHRVAGAVSEIALGQAGRGQHQRPPRPAATSHLPGERSESLVPVRPDLL